MEEMVPKLESFLDSGVRRVAFAQHCAIIDSKVDVRKILEDR